MTTAWGALPESVRTRLRELEWTNLRHLRERLLGKRPFPIRIGLKPPTGRQALDGMPHFQAYMAAWRDWLAPGRIEYQTCNLTQVGRHDLPTALVLEGFDELASFLGPEARARQRHWEAVFEPLCAVDRALYPCLVRNLASLEVLSTEDSNKLASTLRQLRPGLCRGSHLRALPLSGVDTKFVEDHLALLTDLADTLHAGDVTRAGSLETWLECRETPSDWLFVRALCRQGIERLGGIDLMQVPASTLMATPLPGRRVLIVENTSSGYALPPMEDTVAVFGGGANVRWVRAAWLSALSVGYWGDIDTWGLHYLATVRQAQPHVTALMMDHDTIRHHLSGVVDVKDPNPLVPTHLVSSEVDLYRDLLERRYGGSCLEQERVSADWIRKALEQWHKGAPIG